MKEGKLIADKRVSACSDNCPMRREFNPGLRDNSLNLDLRCNVTGILVRHMKYKPTDIEFSKAVKRHNNIDENDKINAARWYMCKNKYLRYEP